MLFMDHPSMIREYLPDYDKKATWEFFYAYIDSYCKRLIAEYPGYGVQAISILQYQCANTTFDERSIYNRLFQQVAHREG